jgi:hypothetical protein
MHFKIQKFTSQNLVYQAAVFCVRNAPKVTYERLKFENFFRGLYPRTIVKKVKEDMRRERRVEGRERGGEGRGRQGEGGKGRREGREESGAPSLQASAPCFPWAGYGPDYSTYSEDYTAYGVILTLKKSIDYCKSYVDV